MYRCVLLFVLAAFAWTGTARAADPIMPLSEVRAGMSCTGLSVVRGTEIASFDVQVLDVIAGDDEGDGGRILVRVSGPAVDATGIGPGFSGSPILCDGRNAGALSEGIGEYGNDVALATPIEAILGSRPTAAAGFRAAPRLLRSAHSLAGPLTVSGLSAHTRRLLSAAAGRAGHTLLATPPGPLGGYAPQQLVPGAAVGAALSTGDVSVSAVGTVAYRDGDRVFAFGHALDGLGRRALFLHDAYVFGVIDNPLGVPDLGAMTYKLTSSGGHPLGTVDNDTFSAISGSVGATPPAIPLRVSARERGGSRTVALDSSLADERALGLGANLGLVAPLAASTAIDKVQRTSRPAALSVCTRFRVSELRRPIEVCNAYFDGLAAVAGVAQAAALVDSFDLAPLHIRGAAVGISVQPDFADDVLVGARALGRARPGSRVAVRVRLRRRLGGSRSVTVRVPVPADVRPGRRTLVLSGNGLESSGEGILAEIVVALFGEDVSQAEDEPRTVRELAAAVSALRQPLGIEAHLRRRDARVVLRSSDVLYEGRVEVKLRVVRRRR